MAYDDLDRLISVDSPMYDGTIAYTYDAVDNLRTLTDPTRKLRYCYDAGNRLTFIRSGTTAVPVDCNSGAAITALGYNTRGTGLTYMQQRYYDAAIGRFL